MTWPTLLCIVFIDLPHTFDTEYKSKKQRSPWLLYLRRITAVCRLSPRSISRTDRLAVDLLKADVELSCMQCNPFAGFGGSNQRPKAVDANLEG